MRTVLSWWPALACPLIAFFGGLLITRRWDDDEEDNE